MWVRRASGSSGCVEYNEGTCGRWSSVSESLPAYGAIGSAVGRGDGTPLNLGELRIPEMEFRLPPKNPTTLVVRSVNPAISLFVTCDTEEEINRVFEQLSQDGKVLMPLAAYPFSERFGWVEDKYGVSWQLNLAKSK